MIKNLMKQEMGCVGGGIMNVGDGAAAYTSSTQRTYISMSSGAANIYCNGAFLGLLSSKGGGSFCCTGNIGIVATAPGTQGYMVTSSGSCP
jgi:hypothetical protein